MVFIKILYECVIVIGIFYLYILLCKYLNLALKNNQKKNNNIIIENESNKLIVNSSLIKSFNLEI